MRNAPAPAIARGGPGECGMEGFHSELRTPNSELRLLFASGQAIVEYAILIGVVAAAILAMSTYARRGIQSGIRATTDVAFNTAVNIDPLDPDDDADPEGEKTQKQGMEHEVGERVQPDGAGTLLAREAAALTERHRRIRATSQPGGILTRDLGPSAANNNFISTTGALTNRGAGVSSYSEVVAEVTTP